MNTIILKTSGNWSATALRIVLGVVVFSHGAQAMLGWFDGAGLSATLGILTSAMGLPWIVALAVICIQFIGSLMLIFGIGTRVAALGLFGIFVGMLTYHLDYGFHMNWFGTKQGEGFEYHVLVMAMCLSLILQGGGAISVDRSISNRIAS